MAHVSGRKLWAQSKLWLTLRDAPETLALFGLVGLTLAQGVYTAHRMYMTPAGEAFPSVEVRRDPEKQVLYGPHTVSKSLYCRVAEMRHDDRGWHTGVFDNRGRPYEYNLTTKAVAAYETDASNLD